MLGERGLEAMQKKRPYNGAKTAETPSFFVTRSWINFGGAVFGQKLGWSWFVALRAERSFSRPDGKLLSKENSTKFILRLRLGMP